MPQIYLHPHGAHSVGAPGYIAEYFSLDGLGVTIPMNVNGTVPKNFDLVVPAGQTWLLSSIAIIMEDATAEPADFMGFGAKLTNGIAIHALNEAGAATCEFCGGIPLKSHHQFGLLGGVSVETAPGVAKDDVVRIVWRFVDFGGPLRVTAGEGLRIIISDNLTGLSDMRAMAHGHQVD